MREKKKPEGELPIARKVAAGPDIAKVGREPEAAPKAPASDRTELELLEARLFATRDANERRELIDKIQKKFGNDKVAQLLRDLQQKEKK
jgi:hypothetical protein